ncbi:DNA invertase [Candidatus Epulonipiscium fishelsonii]|nr:DNA invertase [Epulopiscium sp. SCG-B05WGA-EpuloA1]
MKTIINYKPKEFAELLNVSVKTLQRWDREKILIAKRNPNNRRYYTYDQYLSFKGLKNEVIRKIIIYARVSTNNQKEDLINQIKFMQTFANVKGIIVDEIIQDIGSGLNYNRKKWNKLIDEVMENKIDTIIITHKDRFIRFGFEWFERLLLKFDTKIVIINNEFLSPQEELIQDIISILQVFSCKIYGFKKYKKQIQEDKDIEKSIQNRIKING